MIELDKIKPTAVSAIITCIAAFFCIELLIFLLNRELFLTLDVLRLASIGIGLTAPFLIANGIIAKSIIYKSKKNTDSSKIEEEEKLIWGISGLITILLVSFVSLIGFSFHFSLYKAIWILFYIELFSLVGNKNNNLFFEIMN